MFIELYKPIFLRRRNIEETDLYDVYFKGVKS